MLGYVKLGTGGYEIKLLWLNWVLRLGCTRAA